MGIISQENVYIKKLIEDQIDTNTSKLNFSIDGLPTYGTYYSIDLSETTLDGGFEAVESELGKNSGIVLKKFENCPLFGIPVLNPSLNEDEEGLDIELEISDIKFIPNTLDSITPKPNDFFVCSVGNNWIRFRITSIEYGRVINNDFYKLSLEAKQFGTSEKEVSKSLMECVNSSYKVLIDNIGTEHRSTLVNNDFILYTELINIYRKLKENFLQAYYSDRHHCITICINGKYYYDKMLNMFIINNKLLYSDSTDNKALVIQDVDEDFINILYKKTIFGSIEYGYQFNENSIVKTTQQPLSISSSFNLHHDVCDSTIYAFNNNPNVSVFFDNPFNNIPEVGAVFTSDSEEESWNIYQKIVFNYMNESFKNELFDMNAIMEESINISVHNMYLIPMVLFIIYNTFRAIITDETL